MPSSTNTPRGNINQEELQEETEHYDSTKPLNEEDFMQTQQITEELRKAVNSYGYGGEEE